MATRSLKHSRIIQKPVSPQVETGPSPFPLLVLVLFIMIIFLVRLRAEERNPSHSVATRTELPDTVQ